MIPREDLIAILKEYAKCLKCKGKGTIYKSCTLCGDSTYDHNCNDEDIHCSACGGSGYPKRVWDVLQEEP